MDESQNFIISFWNDLFGYRYWRNAVLGGLAISTVCSLLSVYVVLRRMAFIGQGISHSALGGFGLGLLLFGGGAATVNVSGILEPAILVDVTALGFCLGVALLIGATTRHSKVSEDSAIGIFFVASMALGVVFVHMIEGYAADLYSFLFGSILGITEGQLWVTCITSILVMVPLLILQKELLYYTFDEEMAGVSGVPVNFLHFLLHALLSVTIVISARMIGILLVSAFLILPGAIAQLLTQKFRVMVQLSLLTGIVTTVTGLFLANAIDWPSGATVVLLQVAVFAIVFMVRKLQGLLSV